MREKAIVTGPGEASTMSDNGGRVLSTRERVAYSVIAPSVTMLLLPLTGFDGTLVQQTPETRALMQVYLVAGTFVAFGAAFACSLVIRLRREDVVQAQAQLASA